VVALIVLLIPAPCFWQPRILAGDLPSHVYNAWLASLVAQGSTPGLELTPRLTNVLTDFLLTPLVGWIGPAWAEKLVAAVSVEIFFWGAFAFTAAAAGRRSWVIAPSLAMLSYGLIFQLGFLNFYVSTGLCLWSMALLWKPSPQRCFCAIPIVAAAFVAHVIPLFWAASVLAYVYVSRTLLKPQSSALQFVVGAALLFLFQFVLRKSFPVLWTPATVETIQGLAGLPGALQFLVYGNAYWIPAAGILIIWFLLLVERLGRPGVLLDPLFQLWCLSMLAYVLLPMAIQFSPEKFPLTYIQPRACFFTALIFCALIASGGQGRNLTQASVLVAGVFFFGLFRSQSAFNRIEQEIAVLVESLPPGTPVIGSFRDTSSVGINGLAHVIDAACVERCFDYGNYEPATGQFRIQVQGPNKFAAPSIEIFRDIEEGKHVITAGEAPLYAICSATTPGRPFEIRELRAGETTCKVEIAANPGF
jgi:hypothetical protein